MSRYIDADEAVTMIALQMPFIIQGFEDNKRTAQRIIGSLPSIDIVRCKECKHYDGDDYGEPTRYCVWHESPIMPDDFCNYGERRE